MRYLLDTDHISVLQHEGPCAAILAKRLDSVSPLDYATSVVCFHEQTAGWLAYLNDASKVGQVVQAYRRLDQMRISFQRFTVLPFDEAAETLYENLRLRCRSVGTLDLRIASIAIATDSILLTRNFADFEKVPGPRFEDWTAP